MFAKTARLIKERKSTEEILDVFSNTRNFTIRRYIEKTRNKDLLNEEDSAYSQAITQNLRALDNDIPDYVRRYAALVLQMRTLEEIKTAFPGANRQTLYAYAHSAKRAGLLARDATEYLDSRVEVPYHNQIAVLVRAKRPLSALFTFFAEKNAERADYRNGAAHETAWDELDETERKARLNRVFERLYHNGLLTTADTAYLKADDTVVGRNGDTKGKILDFLNDAKARGLKAGSKVELSEFFNESDFQAVRAIKHKTFACHIKEMIKDGRIFGTTLTYVKSCKGRTRR